MGVERAKLRECRVKQRRDSRQETRSDGGGGGFGFMFYRRGKPGCRPMLGDLKRWLTVETA